MKNYRRAYRRHKKHVKFIKRLKDWIKQGYCLYIKDSKIIATTGQEIREQAIKGECYTFLRTTGRPCNCASCTYYKYKREQKQYRINP